MPLKGKNPLGGEKMAFYPELKGPALDAYRQMVQNLLSKAEKELGLTRDQLVVRDLRPEDIGASSADFYVGTKATSWLALVDSQTIGDNRFVGINGIVLKDTGGTDAFGIANEPPISQLKVTRKGSVARYWNVKPVWAFEDKVGYCDDPITVDQNTTITVEAWARSASSLGGFTLIGAVVEKKGLLINP